MNAGRSNSLLRRLCYQENMLQFIMLHVSGQCLLCIRHGILHRLNTISSWDSQQQAELSSSLTNNLRAACPCHQTTPGYFLL